MADPTSLEIIGAINKLVKKLKTAEGTTISAQLKSRLAELTSSRHRFAGFWPMSLGSGAVCGVGQR
ncbi:hypothetical protein ACOJBM_43350 [Rhizobium beringeri]